MFRRLFALPLCCAVLFLAILNEAPRGQSGGAGQPAAGATTILGSVVDASLAPLPGVVVTLERDGKVVTKTTSGADGTFRFSNIAAGGYRVRAERAGFTTVDREVRIPAGVATVKLPIVLARPGERPADAQMNESVAKQQTAGGVAATPPAPIAAPSSVLGAPRTAGAGGGGGRGGGMAVDELASSSYPGRPYPPEIYDPWAGYRYRHSGERYAHVEPNRFQSAWDNPLSTFGADVDTASYSNVRRFLSSGQLPPRDAVRVEEFVNSFRFDYDVPRDGRPIALTTEVGDCPWAPSHKLVLIGARAKSAVSREIGGRNIVILLDVSGSMAPPERLPLLQSAFQMFVDTLRPDDRVAIVTYAGTSGVALPSTSVRHRDEIQRAIAGLRAGGSTNGGSGITTAYRVAREAFIPGGVNRVVLATDGDFNVGLVTQRDLFNLIERERDSGVFLSVLGVGSGNLQDRTMEMLADKGNGHYAYLDSLQEARRVLVREGDATLETVAKDVKFQVEFNPAIVSSWKLIGYENRLLAAQDFNDDRKDGGEMGAGHTVTVLYEIVPVGVESPDADRGSDRARVDPLKYQGPSTPPPQPREPATDAARSGEWLTVKARYKMPEGEESQLLTRPVTAGGRAPHLALAASLADFGLLLRSGQGNAERWSALAERVSRLQAPVGQTVEYAQFAELVAIANGLSKKR